MRIALLLLHFDNKWECSWNEIGDWRRRREERREPDNNSQHRDNNIYWLLSHNQTLITWELKLVINFETSWSDDEQLVDSMQSIITSIFRSSICFVHIELSAWYRLTDWSIGANRIYEDELLKCIACTGCFSPWISLSKIQAHSRIFPSTDTPSLIRRYDNSVAPIEHCWAHYEWIDAANIFRANFFPSFFHALAPPSLSVFHQVQNRDFCPLKTEI